MELSDQNNYLLHTAKAAAIGLKGEDAELYSMFFYQIDRNWSQEQRAPDMVHIDSTNESIDINKLFNNFPKHDIEENGRSSIVTPYYDPSKKQGLFNHVHGAQVQAALDCNKHDSYATPFMDKLNNIVGVNNPIAQIGRSLEQGLRGSTQGLRNLFCQVRATQDAINTYRSQGHPDSEDFPGLDKDIGI